MAAVLAAAAPVVAVVAAVAHAALAEKNDRRPTTATLPSLILPASFSPILGEDLPLSASERGLGGEVCGQGKATTYQAEFE